MNPKFAMSLVCAAAVTALLACVQPAPSAATGPAAARKAFVHPGLLHTEAGFARMKARVAAGERPWSDGWQLLIASPHAQLGWKPRPLAKVVRGAVPGQSQNYPTLFNDIHAAYQLALRWKISGDEAYARKSIETLNGWASTLKEVTGNSDRFLAAGIYGYQFANAAEIMRTYPGWAKDDFARFQNMMLAIFYAMNHDFLTRHNDAAITNYWANWDLCNIASMQAIGVLCDRRDIYEEAITYFKTGKGNGAIDKAVYYVHPGYLGQWQEAGRDQGHTTLGIALMGPICETAWNQGDDFYSYDNNRFLAGAEYVAKYNLGHDVPFQPYIWGTGQRGERREQPVISAAGRGALRAGYEIVVNHYVKRRGIAAPYSVQYAAKLRPEGGGGGHASTFDQLGFGTLTAIAQRAPDPQVESPRPGGLTARKSGASVVLSWWGAADATSYNVKRAALRPPPSALSPQPSALSPYATIAADVKDPLTYADRDLKAGNYSYIVTAVRAGKETGPSNEVRVSTVTALQTQLKFDETRGTAAADAVNNAQPGTLHGGAAWEAGKTGNAVSLDGKDDYVSLPASVASRLSDFTIAAWVYLNENKTWARVFDFGDDRGRSMFLTPRSGGGKVRFATSTVYGYNEQAIDGKAALPANQWVHVAVTLSGRVGTLYVNGVAVGSNPAMDFPPFQIGNTPQNWIGRSQNPNDPYLNGKVDDLRIYDGALHPQEVAALAGGKDIADRSAAVVQPRRGRIQSHGVCGTTQPLVPHLPSRHHQTPSETASSASRNNCTT
jgi:concanavalin A-like lectin/glucanase superfamily protein/alginate lyase